MSVKRSILSLFYGLVFRAISSQLKGVKLKITPLFPVRFLWKNVEPEKHYIYKQLINDGNIIFDIGANVGLHSYFFARNFKSSQIISFEPLPENIEYLKETIERNKIQNIKLIECAIAEEVGVAYFNTANTNSTGFVTDEETALRVKVDTLDNFISTSSIKPHFIKIDVEGAERKVLNGFKEQIKIILPIMVIELHNPENDKKVNMLLGNLPYDVFRLKDKGEYKNGKPLMRIKNKDLGWPHPDGFWGNIVVIPKESSEKYAHLVE